MSRVLLVAMLCWPVPAMAGSGGATATTQSAQPIVTNVRSGVMRTGNWMIDGALIRIALSGEQIDQLAKVLEPHRAAVLANETKDREQADLLRRRMADTSDPVLSGELGEKLQAVLKAASQRRLDEADRMASDILPILTPDQRTRFTEMIEEWSGSPAGRVRAYVRALLAEYDRITLTDEQKAVIADLLAKRYQQTADLQEKHAARSRELWDAVAKARSEKDLDAETAARAELAQINEQWAEHSRQTRLIIEERLTDRQRKQLKAAEDKSADKWRQSAKRSVTQPLAKLDLSAEQRKKIDALLAAADTEMTNLAANDWQGRAELLSRLQAEVNNVLTDRQRQEINQLTD